MYSGSGNVKRVNTQGRLAELTKAFMQYYKLVDVEEEACLDSGDNAENSEVNSDASSSVEETSEEEEIPASDGSEQTDGVLSESEDDAEVETGSKAEASDTSEEMIILSQEGKESAALSEESTKDIA